MSTIESANGLPVRPKPPPPNDRGARRLVARARANSVGNGIANLITNSAAVRKDSDGDCSPRSSPRPRPSPGRHNPADDVGNSGGGAGGGAGARPGCGSSSEPDSLMDFMNSTSPPEKKPGPPLPATVTSPGMVCKSDQKHVV
eukprot:TRINITY_DN5908_c0_g1_i1.p1 TRINITY_DN5908_c0_g1~~TRINITY_DN5908_c0_g1_i1.p1  ORF type:complete len:143 (-),score=13.01 TRINITY_DN5908_c0_g1_i1:12-440(-)